MRVAIIGLGRMGLVHSRALGQIGAELAAGFDVSPETVDSFFGETGVPSYTIDEMNSLLPKLSLDGVIVATTTLARFEIISAILKATTHAWILAEKPISSSLQQLALLKELADEASSRLAVNHQMMFLPQYTTVREFVDSKQLGQLRSMTISGANFGLANNVSHYFEAFRFLTQCEVSRVSGFLERQLLTSHRGEGFVDYAGSIWAKGIEGATLYVDFGSQVGHGISASYSFDFGKVVVDELLGKVRVSFRKPEDFSQPSSRYGLESLEEEFLFEPMSLESATARVIEAVANSSMPYPDYEVASHTLRCIVGAVASDENDSRPQSVQPAALADYYSRVFAWS